MQTQQTAVNPDDVTTQITTLEQTLSGLIDPARFADTIMDTLNDLAQQEADPASLDAIFSSANALTETASTLNQTMRASLHLAKTVKEQRDAARKALADLREAMRTVDFTDPDVEALRETVEEIVIEWHQESWFDEMEETYVENIVQYTPLDYHGAEALLDLLTGGGPDIDSYIWSELSDWIRRAQNIAEVGCEPMEFDEDDSPLED